MICSSVNRLLRMGSSASFYPRTDRHAGSTPGGRLTGCDAMSEIAERALNPAVAPARVLIGEAHDQAADLFHDAGPACSLRGVSPHRRDQAPVPAQDRVGRDDRRDLRERAAAEDLALGRESPPLIVREWRHPPAQLLPQPAVLLDQVLDDPLLPTAHPTS